MAECPREALRDATLPDGAKTVLTALWMRAGTSRRFVWPNRETLAQDCGMRPRTLRGHLATLKARMWITEHVGEETGGNPGWYLCDPPGTPQVLGVGAAVGAHGRDAERQESAKDRQESAKDRQESAKDRQESAKDRQELAGDRQELAGENSPPARTRHEERQELAAPTSIGTKNKNGGSGYARDGEDGDGRDRRVQPPPPRSVSAQAWRADFVYRWRGQFNPDARGCRVPDPTSGAHRLVELQRALDEHGGDVVTEVLLHAGERVVRHHESDGRHGLLPKMFSVTFRADKPQAFDALLDAWQADTRRKRVSGRSPVAPAEIDGVPLTDEEQRVWMRAQGDDPDGAVREARAKAEAGREHISSLLDGMDLLGAGGVM